MCQDDCPSFGFLGLRGKCGLILILFFALVNKTITSDDQHVVSLTLWLLSLLHEANCHFDVETITKMVMASFGNHPFGYRGTVTEPVVREILQKVVA